MKKIILLIFLLSITLIAQNSNSDFVNLQQRKSGNANTKINNNENGLGFVKDPASGLIVYKISDNVSPNQYTLDQNYPNPFNPTTKIRFSIAKESTVKLTVYNMLGQVVSSIFNGRLEAGTHSVEFNGSSIPSGIYFYRLEVDNFVKIKKMTLMK